MNAVEIEEAISALALEAFEGDNFPYQFLEAFGNKATTIKRLKTGNNNKSDIGGVLQYNNIHIAISSEGQVKETLDKLRQSPATKKHKAKFILATDGEWFEAENINTGDNIVCEYKDFPNNFGFFLSLAGISTVKEIRDSSIDIRATSRLNKLYVELLNSNPEWGTEERRHDMNHFMARLVFCFYAEDTVIFREENLFTNTVEQMSASDVSITHEVISEIFRSMNTKTEQRDAAKIKRWANDFPYVNGGLFSGSLEVPKFTRMARSYLVHVGNLDWRQINPDIFGSMIQAVADDEERGALGMHYTSVPNILKVLNPLFLDDLRTQLEEAGDNSRKLLNLRNRIARIRVFDPACGSGNFLVIAYKQMREIEYKINKRRGEEKKTTAIPLTNFRGIELRDFSAEIARLALIIAEYQCNVNYLGEQLALAEFLPLDSKSWITQGNALRLDWLTICPPTGKDVNLKGDDLLSTPLDQSNIDFENEGGETYICGNPPYVGDKKQSAEQKQDIKDIFLGRLKNYKSLDYVTGWFLKATDFGANNSNTKIAFVTTNSICQGSHVPSLWPLIFSSHHEINFAHTNFKWANLASHNAGVTVIIVGLSRDVSGLRSLYIENEEKETILQQVNFINAYLIPGADIIVNKSKRSNDRGEMVRGNHPYYASALIFNKSEEDEIIKSYPLSKKFILPYYGSKEFISATPRYCYWIEENDLDKARQFPLINSSIEEVSNIRLSKKKDKSALKLGETPYKFREQILPNSYSIVIPCVSSENRSYLPTGILSKENVISNDNFAIYDSELWNVSLIASRLHLTWIKTVCGQLETRIRYSNTLGWNTFPVPKLTEKNKADLTRCAEDILLAREVHFPATIAELYDPEKMPENLRQAHERNDEVLERIYIGRKFKNDTERLEKLFDLYTKMTNKQEAI